MLWKSLLVGLTMAFVVVSLGTTSPVRPAIGKELDVPAGRSLGQTVLCRGGEPTKAVAIGTFSSYMGLYVFDEFGNCVTKDDRGTPETKSDLSAEWLPTEEGGYTVELLNLGGLTNTIHILVIR